MRAWTVDADDIRVADDFDETLLHRTPEIDGFLAPDGTTSSSSSGPRASARRCCSRRSASCISAKGTRMPAERQSARQADRRQDLQPGDDRVFCRVAAAVVEGVAGGDRADRAQACRCDRRPQGQRRLRGLIGDAQLHGVIDHFVRLLDLTPSDLQRVATDTDGHLVPRLRALKSPITIFIDGIDEYFNKHVEELTINASVTGELSPNVWYFSQLGLVEVAYQLRRINHHLKVFAAIRKEAYARLPQRTAWCSSTAAARSTSSTRRESLREIFVNNIRLVKADRMVLPGRARTNPLEAFLGRTSVTDPYTREEEDAFEYVCRHTLLRPRDLMTIGERLAALRPDERRNEYRLKEAVNQAADRDRARVPGRDRALCRQPRSRAALPSPARAHPDARRGGGDLRRSSDADAGETALHCTRCTASACSATSSTTCVRGEWRQRFLRPGEATLDPNGALPRPRTTWSTRCCPT